MPNDHDHDESELATYARGLTHEELRRLDRALERAQGAVDGAAPAADVVTLSAEELKICKDAGCDPNVFAALKYGVTPKE